jgi:hypothetical protein
VAAREAELLEEKQLDQKLEAAVDDVSDLYQQPTDEQDVGVAADEESVVADDLEPETTALLEYSTAVTVVEEDRDEVFDIDDEYDEYDDEEEDDDISRTAFMLVIGIIIVLQAVLIYYLVQTGVITLPFSITLSFIGDQVFFSSVVPFI